MTSRRDFVAGSAALLGYSQLGQLARDVFPTTPAAKLERIGLELYTVRAEMRKDVAATLKRVAEIGYKEVEFAGYFAVPADQLRGMLDANGLTSPSVHASIELLEREWATQAAFAKVLGHRWVIVPSLNTRTLTTATAWKGIAARFSELGRKARDAGLRFAFHNHAVEPAPIADGSIPLDILLNETDPAIVDFQMDLYWMIKAGGDPLAYFAKYPGRFPHVHVKDGAPSPLLATGTPGPKEAMQQRDVGSGSIDWVRILEKRAQAGIHHYYVEHDEPGADAFASVTRSYNYLAKLEFR